MNSKPIIIVFVLLVFLQYSCKLFVKDQMPELTMNDCKVMPFQINDLPLNKRPYYKSWKISLENPVVSDENGIALFTTVDSQKVYHPVLLAQRALSYFNGFYHTNDTLYKQKVDLYLDKLMEMGDKQDSSIFFPYPFDFVLHGRNETMHAPWYSAMAQGQALSCFARMYSKTEDKKYLCAADSVYNSLSSLYSKNKKLWVTAITQDSLLWLEEYPDIPINKTLNGKIFAIFGIYDYYQITKREDVKQLLQASLTTIYKEVEKFRVPGDKSYYCLKHKVQNAGYHKVHIRILKELYDITGEPYFREVSDLLKSDYWD